MYEELSNPPNPIIGEGIAQFAFDGAQDGAIRMDSNEKLWIIEKDEGDGWTRVRKWVALFQVKFLTKNEFFQVWQLSRWICSQLLP